jgi:gamma-glutamyltranspeptidase/glutathione hydrolase
LGLAVVDGWFEMHNKFGKLSMQQNLQDAIDDANNGFPLTELIAYDCGYWVLELSTQPGAFSTTYTIDGKAPKKGEIFKNLDLANTLSAIAFKGRDAFHKRGIAKKIDLFMKNNGGFLRYQELANHTSSWVEILSVNYRGYDVFELPPMVRVLLCYKF